MSNASPTSNRNPRASRAFQVMGTVIIIAVGTLIYFAVSTPRDVLSTAYGQRRGTRATDSVNGTSVLAAMFEQAGHRVVSISELSRRIDNYQTLVWFPDDIGAPSGEARLFLESWLASGSGRTLVYVGRDYDAAPEYWERMLHVVEDPQHDEYQRRFAQAQAEYDYRRARMPNQHYCDWFTMETDRPTRKIPDLEGPWAKDIDASKTNIVLAGRLDIPEASDHGNTTTPIVNSSTPRVLEESESWDDDSAEYEEYEEYKGLSGTPEIEILLQSENDILAHRYRLDYWNSSQVIVVANGSFLLNMPLVEKEHRKLAGKLIAECGSEGRVAFLESGPAGVRVQKSNLAQSNMFAHRILTVWPISFIVIQFAILGITFCIAMFPIFGRPQHLREESRSDFGQHVAALGELLHKTKDTFFAQSKIRQYQAIAKRGSGQSHRENLPQPLAATVLEQPQPNS